MDVLAGQRISAPLSVKVSAVRAETPANAPEPLELPADRPRPARPDHAGALVRLELEEEVVAAPRALEMRHCVNTSTTLLAGWTVVPSRLSGQTERGIGTSTGSRGRREAEGLIGCCVNPLPVRVDLSGSILLPGGERRRRWARRGCAR
jgi:hypothetical protein